MLVCGRERMVLDKTPSHPVCLPSLSASKKKGFQGEYSLSFWSTHSKRREGNDLVTLELGCKQLYSSSPKAKSFFGCIVHFLYLNPSSSLSWLAFFGASVGIRYCAAGDRRNFPVGRCFREELGSQCLISVLPQVGDTLKTLKAQTTAQTDCQLCLTIYLLLWSKAKTLKCKERSVTPVSWLLAKAGRRPQTMVPSCWRSGVGREWAEAAGDSTPL